MDKSVVERGKHVCNAENVFTFADLWAQRGEVWAEEEPGSCILPELGSPSTIEECREGILKEIVKRKRSDRKSSADRGSGSSSFLGRALPLRPAAPAHAGILEDEIIPYAGASSFAILWGIVLGFVLLRLQEAFPE